MYVAELRDSSQEIRKSLLNQFLESFDGEGEEWTHTKFEN
jgi:hypothetical protein